MVAIRKHTLSAGDGDIIFVSFPVEGTASQAAICSALAECDRQVGLCNVARQTFFLAREADRPEVERAVAAAYGPEPPCTTYAYQPPVEGHPLSVELWAFSNGVSARHEGRASAVRWAGATWSFVGGLEAGEEETVHQGFRRILKEAQQEFKRTGADFKQVVRTWYYVGNILGLEGGTPRYYYSNQARNEFYRDKWPDLCATPASTGIGMSTNRLAFEAFAVGGEEQAFQVMWVDNPLQTPPYRYDLQSDEAEKPSFSRAAAVKLRDCVLLFVSGTASIRGSQVLCGGDPGAQTEITIENIAALIGADNLVGNYGFSRGAGLGDVQQLRVYVKRPADLDIVRDCCRRHLPEVPQIYLAADVCRPEFLVEIEAVVAFRDDTGAQ